MISQGEEFCQRKVQGAGFYWPKEYLGGLFADLCCRKVVRDVVQEVPLVLEMVWGRVEDQVIRSWWMTWHETVPD